MAAQRVRPKSKEEGPKPGSYVPGTLLQHCRYCGHPYYIPCDTDAKANRCSNVKLKDKKKSAAKKKR